MSILSKISEIKTEVERKHLGKEENSRRELENLLKIKGAMQDYVRGLLEPFEYEEYDNYFVVRTEGTLSIYITVAIETNMVRYSDDSDEVEVRDAKIGIGLSLDESSIKTHSGRFLEDLAKYFVDNDLMPLVKEDHGSPKRDQKA